MAAAAAGGSDGQGMADDGVGSRSCLHAIHPADSFRTLLDAFASDSPILTKIAIGGRVIYSTRTEP
jgi:hypothetical protein